MAGSSSQTEWDPWTHHSDVGPSGTGTWADLGGYEVEATDGHIGKIDEATYEVGSSYVVVDTGPWIFGSKVMLPAGTIDRLDRSNRRAYVACSKDEITRPRSSTRMPTGTWGTGTAWVSTTAGSATSSLGRWPFPGRDRWR
jgi:hypothetical protein